MSEQSLQSRVLLTVLFSVLFMVVTSVGLGVHFFREDLGHQLREKGQILADLQAQAIAAPLWQLDDLQVAKLLQDLSKDGDFVHVDITDTPDEISYSYGRRPDASDQVLRVTSNIEYTDNGRKTHLGILRLTLSYAHRDAAFRAMVTASAVVTVFMLCVVLGMIYVSFRQLTVPLDRMSQCMHTLVAGGLSVTIPDSDRRDEIGRMAQALQVFKSNALEMREMAKREAEAEDRNRRERQDALDAIVGNFEQSISSVVEMISAAALALTRFARDMSATAENSSDLSAITAVASEEAATNIQVISQSAEELTASMGSMLVGIDEALDLMDRLIARSENLPNVEAGEQVSIADGIRRVKEIAVGHQNAVKRQFEAACEISRNVAMVSEASSDVSRSVLGVKKVAREAEDAAMQINVAAADLNVQADILQVESSAFLTRIQRF